MMRAKGTKYVRKAASQSKTTPMLSIRSQRTLSRRVTAAPLGAAVSLQTCRPSRRERGPVARFRDSLGFVVTQLVRVTTARWRCSGHSSARLSTAPRKRVTRCRRSVPSGCLAPQSRANSPLPPRPTHLAEYGRWHVRGAAFARSWTGASSHLVNILRGTVLKVRSSRTSSRSRCP